MMIWPSRLLGTIMLLVAGLATPAGASVFSNGTLFDASGRSIWSDGPAFVYDSGPRFAGGSWNVGKQVGDVECFLGACAGAELGASTQGRFGFGYGLKVNSGSFDVQLPGQVSFSTPDRMPSRTVGAITVGSSYTSSGLTYLPTTGVGNNFRAATLQVDSPSVSAYLDLAAQFHAFAGARVCVGICYGPSIGPIDFDKSQELASVNRDGNGAITVLGQTVTANQDVSALNGLINANLKLPDLDSSSLTTPGGFDGTTLTSTKRDRVATVTANLAQIAADAIGLPIPLSGKLGPIGYNLLQVGAGLALDVEQTLKFIPDLVGKYIFSSPVTPVVNGVQGATTSEISFNLGDSVTFMPGQVGKISYTPVLTLRGTVSDTIDLVLGGSVNVKALGVDVAGLNLGPLINEQYTGDLGRLNVFSNTFSSSFGDIVQSPITLDFAGCADGNYGSAEFPSYGICATSETTPIPGPRQADGSMVDYFSTTVCLAHAPGAFGLCIDIPPDQRSSAYIPTGQSRTYTNGSSFSNFDYLATSPSTTDQDQRDSLASLGYGASPPFVIPAGDPLSAFSATPEPSIWVALIIGYGLTGAATRRARRRPVVTAS